MTRAAIYTRISKDTEGMGLGVERQETEARQLCAARGWEVVSTYSDNDLSAFSGKVRPGYQRLLEAMDARQVDVLVAWHPDRITRHPKELEALIDTLEATKTKVATVQAGDIDLGTPSGRMSARIVGAVARGESEHKSARLTSKMDQLAQSGRAPGGRPPFGYTRNPATKDYEIDKAEARHLRWMAKQVLAGRSLVWIARQSDAKGVTTREGRPWHHATVRATLINPAVAGLRVHRREIAGTGTWEPILEVDEWEQVRSVLADPRRRYRQPAQHYPLSGVLYSTDGVRMVGRLDRGKGGKRDRRTYITPQGSTGAYLCVDAKQVEDFVCKTLLSAFDEAILPDGPEPESDPAAVQAELDELARLRGEGIISMSEWLAAREPLAARLAEAQHVPASTHSSLTVLGKPGALRKAWPDLSDEDRRRIVETVIERIEIGSAEGRGRWATIEDRIDPDDGIVWRF